MAASMRVYISTGATEATAPTNVDSADGTAIKFNREDTQAGTTPIPIPTTATSTNYSWYKNLYLYCNSATGAGTTVSNRKIALASALATGLGMYWKATNTYTQATNANRPADITSGQAGTVPATYTAVTTTATVYDSAGATTANATRNGQMVNVVLGVDNSYAGGANSAATVPNLQFVYDEA